MNLYRLHNGIGEYYVIAESPNEAIDKLETRLDKAKYGFSSDREVKTTELITKEVKGIDAPYFSKDKKLIL